jgi:hypothetical protein
LEFVAFWYLRPDAYTFSDRHICQGVTRVTVYRQTVRIPRSIIHSIIPPTHENGPSMLLVLLEGEWSHNTSAPFTWLRANIANP